MQLVGQLFKHKNRFYHWILDCGHRQVTADRFLSLFTSDLISVDKLISQHQIERKFVDSAGTNLWFTRRQCWFPFPHSNNNLSCLQNPRGWSARVRFGVFFAKPDNPHWHTKVGDLNHNLVLIYSFQYTWAHSLSNISDSGSRQKKNIFLFAVSSKRCLQSNCVCVICDCVRIHKFKVWLNQDVCAMTFTFSNSVSLFNFISTT